MREKYSLLLALATGCFIFLVTALFALLQSPEILTVSVREGVEIPHPVVGHEKCDACHGSAGGKPYPVRHLGWSNGSCTRCHSPLGFTASSPARSGNDSEPKPAPEDETGGSSPHRAEGSVPPARKQASPTPHPVKGYEKCISCHDTEKGHLPAPSDHKGWRNESCEGCHA